MTKIGYWDEKAGKQRERDMTQQEEDELLARQNAPAPVPARHITVLAFRNRFTQSEKVGIEIAKLDDPQAPMATRHQAANLRAYLADLAAAKYVDLDRPDTRAGVQSLETFGLLAAGRALQILDAAIADTERPT